MEEAAVEDAPTEAEAQEERPLERKVEEADVERSSTDRERYSKIGGKYPKSVQYKKETKETDSKPSAKKSMGLERALENANAIGSEHGIDSNEVLSSILAKRMLYEGRKIPDSSDGVHAIIAIDDPDTGELCFAFEKKPYDYPITKYANTLSLYGGSLGVGEPPKEGLAREMFEEDKNSHKIVIKALNETRWKVDELKKDIDGVPSSTHVWLAYIKDPVDVRNYMSSKTAEGEKTILSLTEVLKTKYSDFAFGFGPVVKDTAIAIWNSKQSNYRYN